MKCVLFSLMAAVALMGARDARAAGELTWQELAGRPELWPKQVSVNHNMNFQGGVRIAAGQKVNVDQIKPGEIDLATTDGRLNFAADPDETDALALAGAAYAKLTPKQRVLTYTAIARQKDVWPARVTLIRSFDLGGGQSLKAGDQFTVQDVQPDHVRILVEKTNTTYDLACPATDLMAQARTFVEDLQAGPRLVAEQKAAEQGLARNGAQATSIRLLRELDGNLVSSVTGKPDPFDAAAPPQYLVFLRGSSTCPFTRKFAPSMVDFYNRMKAAHPDFEVIWIMTESPQDTGKFARQLGFSWRAVEYDSTATMPIVTKQIDSAGRLPQLIVMDRAGHVLANGTRDDAPKALAQLDALLKQPGQ